MRPCAAYLPQAGGQHPGGLAFHQDLREALVRRHQRKAGPAWQRVLAVDQRQRPDAAQQGLRRIFGLIHRIGRGFHACCTPSSIMRVISAPKSRPAACIMLG